MNEWVLELVGERQHRNNMKNKSIYFVVIFEEEIRKTLSEKDDWRVVDQDASKRCNDEQYHKLVGQK